MDEERRIVVPVIGEEIGILSVLLPKDVLHQMEREALEILNLFEAHPAGAEFMDPNNKMMQALSFVVQNAFDFYMHNHEKGEIIPPHE